MSQILDIEKISNKADHSGDKNIFEELTIKIQKAEKSFQRAQEKQLKVVEEFNKLGRPEEEALSSARADLIAHLLSFADSKSLNRSLKEDLLFWVKQELTELHNSPFRGHINLSDLEQQYDESVEKILSASEKANAEKAAEAELKILLAQLLQQFGLKYSDDIFQERFAGCTSMSPDEFVARVIEYVSTQKEQISDEEDMDQEDVMFTRDRFETFDHSEFEEDQEQHVESGQIQVETPEEMVNKLYKKLAQKLHPDKATDDAEKARRNTLMHELAEAKSQKDIYALLKLMNTYGDMGDLQFSEHQFQYLIHSMHQKLYQIKQQQADLKSRTCLNNMIYANFNGRGIKGTQEKLQYHASNLESTKKALIRTRKSIKNVKHLIRELKSQSSFEQLFEFF